jgi:hypothetical protein
MFIGTSISRLDDFDKYSPNFIVVQEYTESHMGANYGPPDPPPSMETSTYLSIRGFKTKEDVAAWIKQERESKYSRETPFKVFAIDAMTVKTDITISFGDAR